MKQAATVCRYLLGLIFVFFGANHLWSFLPTGPTPAGVAGQFMSAMTTTHYFFIVGVLEVIAGILLLVRMFVPLALTVLATILVNILLVGFLMAPSALPAGLIAAVLWCVVFWEYRASFWGIFKARPALL